MSRATKILIDTDELPEEFASLMYEYFVDQGDSNKLRTAVEWLEQHWPHCQAQEDATVIDFRSRVRDFPPLCANLVLPGEHYCHEHLGKDL